MQALRKWRAFGVALALTLGVGFAWAQQSSVGGMPSRPRFQSVGIGGSVPTGAGALRVNDTVGIARSSATTGGTLEIGGTSSQKINLYAADTIGDNYIRFYDSTGVSKADVGFTAVGDETFSLTSYEDFRMKFRTGDGTGGFINRFYAYGTGVSNSFLAIESPRTDDTGGVYLRFTEDDPTVFKGLIGFGSTTDNDLDIINEESGAHIDIATTGGGAIRANGNPVATVVSGSFTMTLTGCTANPTATAYYRIIASVVTLSIPSLLCTSNTTAATLTGLPAAIQPGANGGFANCGPIRNNGASSAGFYQLLTGAPTLIQLNPTCDDGSSTFTASGSKGTVGGGFATFTYPLSN